MTPTLDFVTIVIIAVPLTLAVLDLLNLGRRHIHGQMEQIAASAKIRNASRHRLTADLTGNGSSHTPQSHQSKATTIAAASMQPAASPFTGSSTPQSSRSRLDREDALVEFISHSKGSSKVLELLSWKREPIGYNALIDEIRHGKDWSRMSRDLPTSAVRAALRITQAAGLIRLTSEGFSITDLGREIYSRIWIRRVC